MNVVLNKFKEVVLSVLPITLIVLILNYTIAPIGTDLVIRFVCGSLFIIVGLAIFLLGVDIGIQPVGNMIGSTITRTKNVFIVGFFGLLLGFFINVAEPDLLVLTRQVEDVTSGILSQLTIVLVVSIGVGVMVAIGLLRMIFQIPLRKLLTVLYGVILVLAIVAPNDFLGIAFDSGGATTGSMTVPFILALGLGVSSVHGGKKGEEDSFGLTGVASTGPMIAVFSMAILSGLQSLEGELKTEIVVHQGAMEIFAHEFVKVAGEVFIAMLPLSIITILFQIFAFKLKKNAFTRLCKGFVYTYIGFVFFLTGVNAGFMDAGSAIGAAVAQHNIWIVVAVGFIIGCAVILAEPSVHVLNEQVETITSGHIPKALILLTLSIGVSIAISLSMIRLLTPGLELWHLLLPGYIIALILAQFTPNLFVGIAFDSGGVASGPMTATFVLAFAQGVAEVAAGSQSVLDAFGVIAMVALTPLIAIQILGLLYDRKAKRRS